MSRYSQQDRSIALSGLYQAARLAHDLANRGNCDQAAFGHSIDSLFSFDAGDVAEVFGDACNVTLGARGLVRQMEVAESRELAVSRYVIALSHLAGKLENDARRSSGLHDALVRFREDERNFGLGESTRHARLAGIYQEFISTLKPQIMVKGEPLHLHNEDNAARIRSVLLAGIRAAILWRQCGGRRRQLLFGGRRIARVARELLEHCAALEEN